MDLIPNKTATIAAAITKVKKFTSVPKNSSTTEVLFLDNTECRWDLDLFKTRATKDTVSAAAHLSCKERRSFKYGKINDYTRTTETGYKTHLAGELIAYT